MAAFDFSKASAIVSTSPNPIMDLMSCQFGVPSCAMNFAKDVLKAFPSPVLNSVKSGIEEGKELADSVAKDITRAIFLDTGIVDYDTTLGRFVFVSDSSNEGVEEDSLASMVALEGLGKVLGAGARAWAIGEAVVDQINDIRNCIDQMSSFLGLQKGMSVLADRFVGFNLADGSKFPAPLPALEAASQVYEANKDRLEIAGSFIAKADTQINNINSILQARFADPANNPEPCFWENMEVSGPDGEMTTLGAQLSGAGLCTVKAEAGPDGFPLLPPDGDFDPFVDIINVSGMLPPVSNDGQFLFSRTGIYYDSYGGGLDYSGCISNIVKAIYYDKDGNPIPGTGVPPDAVKWLHKYNPNIGGKGEEVSWATFNRWANTSFDIKQIDESPAMQGYYEDDHFLQVLLDQRNREIYDLSSYITDLQKEGYAEDSAVLTNQRQILYSNIAAHNLKLDKRKKQIEVHVKLAPPGQPAVIGSIPINTFEGLDNSLLAIEKQKQEHLIFNPGEVSGVVLPLCPTFIKSEIPQDTFTVQDLMVSPVGVGSIITADHPVGDTSATILSLTDTISTRGLVAVYNFLDADLVTPDSEKYLTINCSTSSTQDKPAQLVASSVATMFPSGVGIPYFRGVCNFFSGVDGDGNSKAAAYSTNNEYLYSPYRPYGYGRLKSGFDEIDSLLYNQAGATFEFWTHVPDLGNANDPGWNADNSLSSLHRVVLGCENRGGSFSSTDASWIVGPQTGSNTVRGMLMGFSRDRRLTQGVAPSNDPAHNNLEKDTDGKGGIVFYMSPTQSVNSSGVTFISASSNESYCIENESAPSGFYGLTVDTDTSTTAGDCFGDCSTAFVHTAVTVDYANDSVKVYLNGNLLKSQNTNSTFGVGGPPNIPSMTDVSSFSYDNQYETVLPPNAPQFPLNSLGQRDFWSWEGPQPEGSSRNLSFTPWIIGGGYTDGMHTFDLEEYVSGSNEGMNFMGGKWGGKKSGLYGFLGSLKLYNRALSAGEARANYEAQRGFFTNIRTYNY